MKDRREDQVKLDTPLRRAALNRGEAMLRIDSTKFGRRLRQIRKYRGLALREVAIAVGKSHATVATWEAGGAIADADITRCARALGCRRFDLLAAPMTGVVTVEAL
jgi:DNA-binding XRE family transcriptional regulator